MKLPKKIKSFNNQCGATAIEYAIIAGLISVIIIGGITAVGTNLDETYSKVGTEVENAGQGGGPQRGGRDPRPGGGGPRPPAIPR